MVFSKATYYKAALFGKDMKYEIFNTTVISFSICRGWLLQSSSFKVTIVKFSTFVERVISREWCQNPDFKNEFGRKIIPCTTLLTCYSTQKKYISAPLLVTTIYSRKVPKEDLFK